MPQDTQIVASQLTPAPLDYLLPGSAEFLLKAVQANFTDDGAGSDWLPAVVLISDSGHVIARAADQAAKVTAGGDAEVSWFPGVKNATSAAAASETPFCSFAQSAGTGTFTAGTHSTAITDLSTNASGAPIFSIDGTNNYQINIAEPGIYGMYGCWSMTNPINMNAGTQFLLANFAAGNVGGVPIFELVNSATTAVGRLQTVAGRVFFQLAAADFTYMYWVNQQTVTNVNIIGGSLWRVSTELVT